MLDDIQTEDAASQALGVGRYGRRTGAFVLWENPETGAYIKPIVWVAAAAVGYFPERDLGGGATGSVNYASYYSTLAVSRFGFEGALNSWASFKLEFQRDLGFSLANGGPEGTSIWEGTASLQARENYINLRQWGLSLSAGIVIDPASVDFISSHVLDVFGVDPFTRDYLLFSGFSLGQGILLRYDDPFLPMLGIPGQLTYGLQVTAGNPLVSSLSFSYGGDIAVNGSLFTIPFRAITNGAPGTDTIMRVYSPSLTYSVDFAEKVGLDLRLIGQIYNVDFDTLSSGDARLKGWNIKGTARLRLPYVNLFGSYANRENDQYPVPEVDRVSPDKFESYVWSAGGEFNYGRFGVGAHFARVYREFLEGVSNRVDYLNIGASYQILPGYLATGVRYAQLVNDPVGITTPTDARTVFLTLRLTI